MVRSCSSSEKTRSKIARGGDFSSLAKVGQQSHASHTFRPSARSDIAKTAQVGNFHVLNREKNSVSHVAKDGSGIGKVMDTTGVTSTAAVLPSKRQTDQSFKVDNKNGAVTHISLGERKLLSQSKNRNDFFNLLRKKSLTSPHAIPEARSTEPTSSLEKEVDNLQITAVNVRKNSLPSVLDCSTENGNVLNGDSCASDEFESFDADNGEINPSSDTIVDPEEEAFLQSLGWDKNAWEEALTEEEIDAFLKKVSELAALFQADSAALLAANAIDVSFPGVENRILPAGLFLRVPAACSCSGGIRRSLSTRYTVRPADTLTSIAASVYSGLATPDQIREANNIRDPAALDVGRTLVIPLPCTCFNSTDNNLPAVYLSYVVLAGDSVPAIAARFSTTITDIMNVNAMGSPSVRPGDILAIPLPG
ncbi:hypothetical protein GW17_00003634 [Ensete ventricosum]|nr:hypothetical protein GW17_00003634 [Ensete ventricosum]